MEPTLSPNPVASWVPISEDGNPDTGRAIAALEMLRLLQYLSPEDVRQLNQWATSILDWGCGLGDSTHIIARAYPHASVTGFDLSSANIAKARVNFTNLRFISRDIDRYDVIIAANALQFADDPMAEMQKHLQHCNKLYVVMVPYKEYPLAEDHISQFRDESFPPEVAGFKRLYSAKLTLGTPQVYLFTTYASPEYMRERTTHPTPQTMIAYFSLGQRLRDAERLWHINQVSDLTYQLQAQQQKNDDLQKSLEASHKSRENLRNELMLTQRREAELSRQLKGITSSHIWRLTAPYRALRNTIDRWKEQRQLTRSLQNAPAPVQPKTPQLPKQPVTTITSPPNGVSHTLQTVMGTSATDKTTYDVIIFSIIDLEGRFQRPQQMAAHLAAAGHRVFYISAGKFLLNERTNSYRLQQHAPNLYEVILRADHKPNIFNELLSPDMLSDFSQFIADLSLDHSIHHAVQIVQQPFWHKLAIKLRGSMGWHVVYDCMDEWEDFPNMDPQLIAEEKALLQAADLVTVTSQVLYDKYADQTQQCLLLRNAVAFDLFSKNVKPNTIINDAKHPIIGYYGALADWVDLDLIAYLAQQRPQWTFILLGDIFVDVEKLEALPNVQLLGRKPHEEMPLYLYHFDVCLIPFKINKITHAVDPVKFYEYISAGKPVVAARIDELLHYEDYLYLAETHQEFLNKVDQALTENEPLKRQKRIALARANDWQHRVQKLEEAVAHFYERFSIVIVTWQNVELTQQCIDSIFRNTDYPDYEIIVVDNASEDGTRAYLQYLAQNDERVSVILNDENKGFAAANNQGIRAAKGERIVLLNNDTIVTRGWLTGLARYLDNEHIGLVGPVTNFVGNAARIDVPYKTVENMELFANEWMHAHRGDSFEIDMLAMYCVAMRRQIIDEIGLLDESYGIGMFEDDDYSARVNQAGYQIICARDVFIHHHGQASFKLLPKDEYQQLWDANQMYYENKFSKENAPSADGSAKERIP